MPVAKFSVPFGLQNVIWNSIEKGAGYSLVGITDDWRVVVLGDSRLSSRNDSLPTQGLNVVHHSEKRTLFEDIFGSSAFSNNDSEPLQSIPSVSSQVRKPEGSRHHDLFDKPAYLMPVIDTLFDPLVISLLNSRISNDGPKISQVDEEDEDVAMIDDTVKQPVFTICPTRIPNQGEMELFTQLFRTTSITCTHSFAPILLIVLKISITLANPTVPSKVNGKVNGMHGLKANGILWHSTGATVSKPKQRLPSDDLNPQEVSTTPEPSVSPNPIFKGKKRKKKCVQAVVSND